MAGRVRGRGAPAADIPPVIATAGSHLEVAWRLFKRHWTSFVLAELAIVAAWLALELAVVAVHRASIPTTAGWVAWLALHLGFLWLFCELMAGIHAMALRAVDGGVPVFTAGLGDFERGRSYVMASLLYWTAILAGLCLAIVPGIVVAVRWALFRFALADESCSALTSLHEAASLSTSHGWRLFRLLALSAALNVAGAALLGFGLLIAFPVTVMLRAGYFRALQQ